LRGQEKPSLRAWRSLFSWPYNWRNTTSAAQDKKESR